MSPQLPARVVGGLTERSARDYLVQALARQLYSDFYLRGRAQPTRLEGRCSTTVRHRFTVSLAAAARSVDFVDDGWRVCAVNGDIVVVAKHGLELTVHSRELVGLEQAASDALVSLRIPSKMPRISPGFYTICGERPLRPSSSAPLLRLYWNLSPDGAPALIRATTERLNKAGIPFRLKVLNDPSAFSRCDAGVLYVEGSSSVRYEPGDLSGRFSWILLIHQDIARHLRPLTPVFTCRLATGLAAAQDPGGDESFGQHRCRLLADGFIGARDLGVHDQRGTVAVIRRRFAAEGVDLDAAHCLCAPNENLTGL
jgi:hypothetical protein